VTNGNPRRGSCPAVQCFNSKKPMRKRSPVTGMTSHAPTRFIGKLRSIKFCRVADLPWGGRWRGEAVTDEGYPPISNAGISKLQCHCEPSAGWCGNPFSYINGETDCHVASLLAMTAGVGGWCFYGGGGCGNRKFAILISSHGKYHYLPCCWKSCNFFENRL
jgi:hypothetical protein